MSRQSKNREIIRKLIQLKRKELTAKKFKPYPDKAHCEYIETDEFLLLVWRPEAAVGDQHAWCIVAKHNNRPVAANKSGNKWHARVDGKRLLSKMLVARLVANHQSKIRIEMKGDPNEENPDG